VSGSPLVGVAAPKVWTVSGDGAPGDDEVTTWHHGLVARWWANFNVDGPEVAFFGELLAPGEPALDAACGSGRLLVPWVAEGFDVDGVDASADMIAACREAAARVGRSPALYVQPLHGLDLPRRYRTIVMCGAFGLGVTRDQDAEGLRRLLAHLEPGGVLALDYEVGLDVRRLPTGHLPPRDLSVPPPTDRRLGPDGFEYALRHRLAGVDPDARSVIRELEAWQWSDGALVAHEVHTLTVNLYTSDEIVDALRSAGFADVGIVGGYHGDEPRGDERFIVYVARRT
jgi:Methyltransferase domain